MARVAQLTPRTFVSFGIAFLLASVAHAQILNVTNTTSTSIPGAGHDYIIPSIVRYSLLPGKDRTDYSAQIAEQVSVCNPGRPQPNSEQGRER
jgi:hypothetical protein